MKLVWAIVYVLGIGISRKSNEKNIPRDKVELHIHLDCSLRVTTVWDLIQKKGLYPEFKTLESLEEALRITKPNTLADFLRTCKITGDAVAGDAVALERIAYELCEDEAKDGVVYFEARYSPHLLIGSSGTFSTQDVVKSINKGLQRGQTDFKIKARTILCCIRGHPEWSSETLDLCTKFREDGVVGIDIAGDEASTFATVTDIEVFKKAKELGVHRTVHAGEAGPSTNVKTAVYEMYAERIGHGYHVLDDAELYKNVLELGIHFEVCPYSSYLTGSVPLIQNHPVLRFAADNASFSINKDDTTPIGRTLEDEYNLLRALGLKEVYFSKTNIDAALASFLPEDEKRKLVNELKKLYKVQEDF